MAVAVTVFTSGAFASAAGAATVSWSAAIPTHPGANYLACPSATQCTAITVAGTTYTFDPAAPGSAPVSKAYNDNDPAAGVSGLTCLNVHACVAVAAQGYELTFDPTTGTASRDRQMRPDASFSGISCFALTDCVTASDDVYAGGYYTFDATSTDDNLHLHSLPPEYYTAISCPSRSECVVIAQLSGWESTFIPGSPSKTEHRINRRSRLNGIACPSAVECVAVNSVGSVIRFNPKAPKPVVRSVDRHDLNGIACSSAKFCAAADRNGSVVYGKPGSARWRTTAVPGAQRLEAIAYAGAHRFVVVDSAGQAYVGTFG